jgi:glycosyltransferase involved in cell wall biosynthesis
MSATYPKISIVTTCKGRLAYLKETIKSWLDIDYPNYEIVVVDYDCPDQTSSYIRREENNLLRQSSCSKISVVEVKDKKYFNLNDARNLGIKASDGELIFMIDSDIKVIRKKLFKNIARDYKKGAVFFSNLQILNSNIKEAVLYYEKYFKKLARYHSVLPISGMEDSLTGTSCFVKSISQDCGGFKPEINERGYGFDDREFYLRYLNYYFYHHYLGPLNRDLIPTEALYGVMSKFKIFPRGSFLDMGNLEEEKDKFYPMNINESREANFDFIHLFFNNFPAEIYMQKRDMDINSFRIPPEPKYVSLLDNPLNPELTVEEWFVPVCLYQMGRVYYREKSFSEAEKNFRRITSMPNIDNNIKTNAYILIGDIKRSQGEEWSDYYLKAVNELKKKKNKSGSDCFLIGNCLYKTENLEDAKEWFKKALRHKTISAESRADALILIGDIQKRTKGKNWKPSFKSAIKFFEEKESKSLPDLYKMASLYKRLNDLPKSEEVFLSLMSKISNSETLSGIYFHMGEIAYMNTDDKKAYNYFKECLELNPSHLKAKEYSEKLSLPIRQ